MRPEALNETISRQRNLEEKCGGVIPIQQMDGFIVTEITTRESRLPYHVYLESLGRDTGMAPPQIQVCIDGYLIPVTISENPEVIAGNIYECRDDILLWVSKHFKVLEAHWNHQFDDPDVHEELKKENHNNTVVAVI